jgi:rRNA processing protein Krr1/Pno1
VPQLTITRIRDLVRALNYVVSIHAADELQDDNLSILDLENIVLTGRIIERQRDRHTRETKVVIGGLTREGTAAEAVVKIGPTGTLFFITVYHA